MSFEEDISVIQGYESNAFSDKNTGRNIINVVLAIIFIFKIHNKNKAEELAKWSVSYFKYIYIRAPEAYSRCWIDLSLKLTELCNDETPNYKIIEDLMNNKV